MAFSYAVITKVGKEWHVSVNNFAGTQEVTTKTLPELLGQTERLITNVSSENKES